MSQMASAMVVNCDQKDWSLSLPSIVDEELGKKVQIDVNLGQAKQFFEYNPQEREFTIK